MAQVFRVYWGQHNGPLNATLNFDGINDQSVVLASVSEGDSGNSTASPARFIGAANMHVDNIAPFDGGVTMRINIDWDSPLNVWTDIAILDEFPQGFLRGS